jgi:hypothetical protein
VSTNQTGACVRCATLEPTVPLRDFVKKKKKKKKKEEEKEK